MDRFDFGDAKDNPDAVANDTSGDIDLTSGAEAGSGLASPQIKSGTRKMASPESGGSGKVRTCVPFYCWRPPCSLRGSF